MTENNQPEKPDPQAPADRQNSESSAKSKHLLTAKDAGWRRPNLFVSPARFVTLDPPVPKKRRPSS